MFGKLKEKLKSALSIFSKKAEEEAEEKKVEPIIEELPPRREIKEESRPEKIILAEKKNSSAPIQEESTSVSEIDLEIRDEIKEEFPPPKKETKTIIDEIKEHKQEKIDSSFREQPPAPSENTILIKKEELKHREKFEQPQRVPEEEKQIISETKIPPAVPHSPREPDPEPEKKSFFGKIKEFITTKTISAEKFEELFWDLELALLENNVSVEVIERIKEDLKKVLVDKPLPRDVEGKIKETLEKTLQEILNSEEIDILQKIKQKKPYIIAFFGINGSGKTTSIAKLTYYFQQHNLSVVLAAGDTFRAAAIQQLEEHAEKLNVKMIQHDYGADAAAVAFDAVKYAEKNKIDVVLIDTAGRLHSNTNLMAELEKIIRVAKPDLKIFVGESITGNDCIEQAQQFNELTELDGVILTKADVDEKGGAPLSIAYVIKKPILFLGMGQKYSDLEKFDKNVILKRLGL